MGLIPRTIPLGSLRLALPCSPDTWHAPGRGPSLPGASVRLQRLWPPRGWALGVVRQTSECGPAGRAGAGGPLVKQPRPKCPPLAVVPSSGSLLLFSAGSRAWPGAGGVSPEKFNSRKQQEETAGWNLHTRQWKTSPTLGRGGRVERAVREERK